MLALELLQRFHELCKHLQDGLLVKTLSEQLRQAIALEQLDDKVDLFDGLNALKHPQAVLVVVLRKLSENIYLFGEVAANLLISHQVLLVVDFNRHLVSALVLGLVNSRKSTLT